MIKQTILPFKLKRTKEEITARSGLAIYGELMKAYQVDKLVSKYLPKPGSGAGIAAINYVRPLSMTLYGGGERIEHTREVRDDKALRVMLGMDIFPSVSAMSYNLFIAQKLFTLPEGWQNKTIKSVRWLLVEVAGKWVEHGRQVILKLAVGKKKFELYLQMRRRIYALSLE